MVSPGVVLGYIPCFYVRFYLCGMRIAVKERQTSDANTFVDLLLGAVPYYLNRSRRHIMDGDKFEVAGGALLWS